MVEFAIVLFLVVLTPVCIYFTRLLPNYITLCIKDKHLMVSKQKIEELRIILKEEFNIELPENVLQEVAEDMVRFFTLKYKVMLNDEGGDLENTDNN